MKIKIKVILTVLFLTIGIMGLKAQPNGEQLFKTTCAVCHQIGNRFVGPDLMGVNDRRDEEWLLRFIKSSQTVIKSGDEYAVKRFKEFNNMIMPDQPNLSDDDIKAILGYIGSFSQIKEETAETESVDSLLLMPENFFEEEVKEGARLFLGLKTPKNGGKACVDCHNIYVSDSLNWNPSAMDLSKYSLKKSDNELLTSLNLPAFGKMQEVHKNYTITEEELKSIKAYLINIGKTGMKEIKPVPKKALGFILFILLIVVAIIDLSKSHIIKYKFVHVLIILISLGFIIKIITIEAYAITYQPGYAPDQPIKFSHKIHADQNRIDCKYCHSTVETSKTAGIPSTNVCMNCHKAVKSGPNSGSFEISKIYYALENNEPVNWIKIHNLPDHVFFSHAQHVSAGKLECQQCHGKVEEMHIVKQVEELSMGWCLECHKKTKVQFNNPYYADKFEKLHKELSEGKIDSVTESMVGGTECQKCHY